MIAHISELQFNYISKEKLFLKQPDLENLAQSFL